jgi:hypothetical protein
LEWQLDNSENHSMEGMPLFITQKPGNMRAIGTDKAISASVCPIQVKKGRNGRIELGLSCPKRFVPTNGASQFMSLDIDCQRLIFAKYTHC